MECPQCPADLLPHKILSDQPDGTQSPTTVLGHDTTSTGDQWACQQLAVDGEEIAGKVQLPQYMLLARLLLTAPLGESHADMPQTNLIFVSLLPSSLASAPMEVP